LEAQDRVPAAGQQFDLIGAIVRDTTPQLDVLVCGHQIRIESPPLPQDFAPA